MTTRLGEVISWGASGLALLIVGYGLYIDEQIPERAVLAAVVWLVGRGAKYLLTGK